jgi:hypothetical protein
MIQVFFIRSKELSSCPICNSSMKVRDSRERHVILQDGTRRTYRLRRLRCIGCRRIHTELPATMLPFKHYEASAIETTIDQSRSDCPADNSTLSRWRKAFTQSNSQIDGALRALWAHKRKEHFPILNRKSLLHKLRTTGPGWLAFVHQILINSGIWLHTQFAFCP